MKRVNYVFNISTNIDEDLVDVKPTYLSDIEKEISKLLSDYKRPEEDIDTTANGKVNVSIDTTQVEVGELGEIRVYGYVIGEDSLEKGISTNIYDWFSEKLLELVEYIMKPNCIKVIPDLTDDEGGGYLKIYTDDIKDKFWLDLCVDDIDDYEE